jgi:hypothetical protein
LIALVVPNQKNLEALAERVRMRVRIGNAWKCHALFRMALMNPVLLNFVRIGNYQSSCRKNSKNLFRVCGIH